MSDSLLNDTLVNLCCRLIKHLDTFETTAEISAVEVAEAVVIGREIKTFLIDHNIDYKTKI
jgi:hypothetical protein